MVGGWNSRGGGDEVWVRVGIGGWGQRDGNGGGGSNDSVGDGCAGRG